MIYDEARMKHRVLLADLQRLEAAAEWGQSHRLERLQRSLRAGHSRLGLSPLATE